MSGWSPSGGRSSRHRVVLRRGSMLSEQHRTNDVGPHSPIGQPEVAGSVLLRPVLQWQLTKTADNSFVKDILRITLHSTQKQS